MAVLSDKATFGFKDLFLVVYENLKARNAVSGGEEMLRLRAYEKLQNLVTRGLVSKDGKVVKHFGSRTSPSDPAFVKEVEALLAQ